MDCIKPKRGSVISSKDIDVINTLKAWNPEDKSIHQTSESHQECKNQEELTSNEIREALRVYEKSKWCPKRLADEMDIKSIIMKEELIYKAKAIVEHREIELTSVPYKPGTTIDGPENGPSPSIWSIAVKPPKDFKFKSKKDIFTYEIPHTAFSTDCDHCHKIGYVACHPCDSTGIHKCPLCNGSGSRIVFDEHRTCSGCGGRGKKSCPSCGGVGRVVCQDCEGSGFVKKFQGVVVHWRVLLEKTDYCELPEEQLENVTFKQLEYQREDCELKSNPLANYSDETVREASERALKKFRSSETVINNHSEEGSRIIRVQQIVIIIPISKVTGLHKGKQETFYVFGNERKVFFPNGDPKDCCFCSIV